MDSLMDGFSEFEKQMDTWKEAVANPEINKEMLEAMAAPIISESKNRVRKDSRLAKGIVLQWAKGIPTELKIGWTNDAFYGRFLEEGYHHIGTQKYIKKPHLRPAYNAKKDEGANAARLALYRHT